MAEPAVAGRVLAGRYTLRTPPGRGGMGTVWLATDSVLGRQVAIKEFTFEVPAVEERHLLRERTLREARAAARFEHPRVTTVHDVVEEDSRTWIVMEHIPSRTLAQVLQDQASSTRRDRRRGFRARARARPARRRVARGCRPMPAGEVASGSYPVRPPPLRACPPRAHVRRRGARPFVAVARASGSLVSAPASLRIRRRRPLPLPDLLLGVPIVVDDGVVDVRPKVRAAVPDRRFGRPPARGRRARPRRSTHGSSPGPLPVPTCAGPRAPRGRQRRST